MSSFSLARHIFNSLFRPRKAAAECSVAYRPKLKELSFPPGELAGDVSEKNDRRSKLKELSFPPDKLAGDESEKMIAVASSRNFRYCQTNWPGT